MASQGISSGTISISNIGNLVSIRLDGDNYLLWKLQFLPVLKANRLLKYIDGTALCPAKFLKGEDGLVSSTVNPAYETWVEQDALVLIWINATLTPPSAAKGCGSLIRSWSLAAIGDVALDSHAL